MILNPSASHFSFGKQEVRERFVLEGSRAFGVSFAYANLLGNEAGRAIFDGGTLIATGGQMLAAGPRLSFGDHILTTAVIDVDAIRRRKRGQSFRFAAPMATPAARRSECCVRTDRSGGHRQRPPLPLRCERGAAVGNWPPPEGEEFARAVPLALFDYLRKSRLAGLRRLAERRGRFVGGCGAGAD